MKKLNVIFSLVIVLCAATFAAAQAKTPRTVEDFYLLLPARYIEPLGRIKNRRQLIEVKDTANGYLRLAGSAQAAPDWEGWGEIALFKKSNGEYVVGVVDGSCATICTSGVEFLEYKNGKWSEVTKQILPNITDRMALEKFKKLFPDSTEHDADNPPYLNYQLPRKGTTVTVNANEGGDNETPLFELMWTGAKFELKK